MAELGDDPHIGRSKIIEYPVTFTFGTEMFKTDTPSVSCTTYCLFKASKPPPITVTVKALVKLETVVGMMRATAGIKLNAGVALAASSGISLF